MKKKKKLDNLIGGVKNSEGNTDGGEGPDTQGGNKGQLNGDPYAPSYFGGSGPGKGLVMDLEEEENRLGKYLSKTVTNMVWWL